MNDVALPYMRMALNNAWANSTLYAALSSLDHEAFTAPRPGFFSSLSRTMNHILEVDLYYLDALENGGRGRSVYDRDDQLDVGALGAEQAETDTRLARFCAGLEPDILSETRETERGQSRPLERVDALLLHLFQHQIHHRGQAHVQLSHAGATPPQLDDFHLEFERAPSAQAYFG